ncbi:YceI family protein [Arsenicicoccus dermatophilus]|uniref:YceI family protein n=1 Tax=Arsenicicoccus dermatophilus TaxID=1076331 RepID=UPI001F4C5BA8|nr:YceI family protein [Arsenicicoccus dermatophilus]MCH8614199.1 YceI family protein [Arsenicicoccus dermatophilus]
MTTLQQLDGTYVIDPTHSQLGFVARHAMVTKVRGTFDEFEGTATTGAGLQGASIEITAQMASIDTRNADRDGHLRTGDFFEVEKYPTMTFRSTSVQAKDEDTLAVTGDLTIKDVTRPITIDFAYAGAAQDPYGNERIGFEGSATIVRSEFGITFNAALETGGVLVSDKIQLEIEVSAIKQA